ncbi:D-2-hydroxyacid dehydrogenase [Haloparvum alkalitolerans]|uniref:NAD(P)-dependent oxidoreductase n=1 Tax=Haloparvum alkalitolerans TaxID=1042953 RepID=UPI003CFB6683
MVDTLGVHGSVDAVFPPATLCEYLADAAAADGLDVTVGVVPDSKEGAYGGGSTDATGENGDETGDGADDAPPSLSLADCDALVTFAYDAAFLETDLEWVHSVQSGVDRFPFDRFEREGVALTNSNGIHGDSVGDTVAGYMLAFARRLHVYRDRQREREWSWPAHDEPFSLRGERICVVGLGGLGRGIVARADALGMDVVGVKRTPTPVEGVNEVYPSDRLHEAVADARFVALAVPLTPATEGLIGAAEFAAMRSDAYLINVARGGVVDQEALVAALERGDGAGKENADDAGAGDAADAGSGIRGAALDVFAEEPLPESSPLWDREEVIVTPHAAAAHREYGERVGAIVAESLRRQTRGEGYANRVV